MFNGFRRTAAAAAAVIALGGGGVAWAATSASASAAPTAIARCTSNNLAVWVNADSADGTAGTTFYHLDFTNTGRSTCFLNGWPGVSATTLGRVQLGAAAARQNGVPAKTIDIPAGGTAHSILGYVDVQVDPSCKPATAAFLKVFAPGAFQAKRAFFPLSVCRTGRVDLNVRRVQAGV
ncbi:MAG TPA: DUF4232 domain-containing protein [Trebonia sp.]|jgi:hypothetical protein|nr:DUF4232 domain-containing protein [Trebonia sp.]